MWLYFVLYFHINPPDELLLFFKLLFIAVMLILFDLAAEVIDLYSSIKLFCLSNFNIGVEIKLADAPKHNP